MLFYVRYSLTVSKRSFDKINFLSNLAFDGCEKKIRYKTLYNKKDKHENGVEMGATGSKEKLFITGDQMTVCLVHMYPDNVISKEINWTKLGKACARAAAEASGGYEGVFAVNHFNDM